MAQQKIQPNQVDTLNQNTTGTASNITGVYAGTITSSQVTTALGFTPGTGNGTVTAVSGSAPVSSSGGTTPAISMAKATSLVDGYLSSGDWTIFNNKGSGTVTSVSGSAPVSSSGGTTPAISMAAANGTTDGYLTSANWTTFNNKGSGTVTAVSVASSNGFAGTSSGGATPALTLSTSITGVLYGNGTSLAASNVTNDAQVKLSTVTTAGDLILATGNAAVTRLGIGANTYVLTSNGTTASWVAPSGGATFPIGAVMASPTAPTGNGTWLECNGQAVSQSTYATLYGVIGHSWMNFTSSFQGQINFGIGTPSFIFWSVGASKWFFITTNSTAVQTSTDGTTWSAATALSVSIAYTVAVNRVPVCTDGANRIMIWGNASTSYNYSSNGGTSWATGTLPTTGSWTIKWNGSYFVGILNNQNTYYSSNGTSWTTSSTVLGGALSLATTLHWDGTYWLIYDRSGFPIAQKTSVSTAASGWTTVITNTPYPSGGVFGYSNTATISIAQNGSTLVATAPGQPASVVTITSALSTYTIGTLPANNFYNSGSLPFSSQPIFWNGYCWVSYTYSMANISTANSSGLSIYTSSDGLHWNYTGNLQNIQYFGSPSDFLADPATGRFILFTDGNWQGTSAITPGCTASTQFCLPKTIGSPKSWIRAL